MQYCWVFFKFCLDFDSPCRLVKILSNKTDQNVQQDICMHEVIKLLVGHSLHLLFLDEVFNQMLSHKAMGVVWFEENIWSLKHSWMFFKMRFLVLDWIARPLLVLKSGVPLSLVAKLRGHKTVITELIKRKICKEKKSASDDSERFWLFVRTPRSLLQLIVLDG